MKLLVLADLHQEFAPFAAPDSDADLVILAGDTDLATKGIAWAKKAFASKPVLYVPGNHEFYYENYENLRAKMQEATAGSNVKLLDCGKFELDGVVVLGTTLWTNFNLFGTKPHAMVAAQNGLNDFHNIKRAQDHRRFLPADALQVFSREKAWLEKEIQEAAGKKLVVVTHHLPSSRSLPAKYKTDIISACFASNLDEMVEQSGAVLWIHGHTHTACDYKIGETRLLCNPRGYPHEGTGFKHDLVVEV